MTEYGFGVGVEDMRPVPMVHDPGVNVIVIGIASIWGRRSTTRTLPPRWQASRSATTLPAGPGPTISQSYILLPAHKPRHLIQDSSGDRKPVWHSCWMGLKEQAATVAQ